MIRNPVLFMMSLFAGANAILALGTLQELVSQRTLAWFVLALAGGQAAMQFWVRGEVTPLTSPRDRDGAPLVPIGSQLSRHAAE